MILFRNINIASSELIKITTIIFKCLLRYTMCKHPLWTTYCKRFSNEFIANLIVKSGSLLHSTAIAQSRSCTLCIV